MRLLLTATNGMTFKPTKLAMNLLHSLPDRPAGAQEICPTAHLDADVIVRLGETGAVDTVTGLIDSDRAAWMVVSMRRDDTALVIALDIGDAVIKRWLADAPADGPVVGLWSPAVARAVRLPVTDALRQIRRWSTAAMPASRCAKAQLFDQLLDCIQAGDLSASLGGQRAGIALQVHLALQLVGMSGGAINAEPDRIVQ
jgi:hypothetical protein